MGFLTGGPFYDMIGRTGNNVGRRVKGKNVFSMRPQKSSKPPTLAQLNARKIFGIVTNWTSWIASLIEVGFQEHSGNTSAMNAAVSYNLKNAVTGIAPNLTLDYTKAMYSRGRLSVAGNPDIEATVALKVKFNWTAELDTGVGETTDKASLMIYNPEKHRFVVLASAAPRSALTYTLSVPGDFTGDLVYCYINFVSIDGKKVSNSTCIGSINVI